MGMPDLRVRPLSAAEIPKIVDYWCNASPTDLERMEVDPAKVPTPAKLRHQIEQLLATPDAKKSTFYLVWTVDGAAVGYSSLKNIVAGDRADMHLHMWTPGLRGKGFGAILFCQSALDFYDRFRLKHIVCEPSAKNLMPNAMLRRVGFPLSATRVGASSDLSKVCQLNTYDIDRRVAERFLAANP